MVGFALGIRYLTGYAVAADSSTRDRAEWPPHPARVFMAMAAAHFENGADPDEAAALRELEKFPPPLIFAPMADERQTVTSFVPVNDHPIGKSPGLLQTPGGWPRSKQPRTFPRVRLHDETVYLVWRDTALNGHRDALERLCRKVTRIGHPSSLVQMWVADDVPESPVRHRWEPDDLEAEVQLRVFARGSLEHLEEVYRMWAAKQSRAPAPLLNGLHKGYRKARPRLDADVPGTVWEPHLVVRRLRWLEGRHRRLDLVATLQLTSAMHKAVIGNAAPPVGECISGHKEDGSPADRPHLALLPLAFVGVEHATGHIMGVAIAVPAGLTGDQHRAALAAVGGVHELKLGALGKWKLERDELSSWNLRSDTWTGGNEGTRQWATVTPVAFDRHAKSKDREERERELRAVLEEGCVRIGLPKPTHVVITPVSTHLGAPASHEFPRLTRKDGSERRHVHAILIFEQPVRGPIALGAGRYRGYGFFRPVRDGEVV